MTDTGPQPFVTPRAVRADEIVAVVGAYRQAAKLAAIAGFDGVELHATSGYLPAQFLSSNTNRRTDAYGGSAEKRARFVLEVIDALAGVCGPQHVGIRIAPGFTFNDIHDAHPQDTYGCLLAALAGCGLAYLHVVETGEAGFDVLAFARKRWTGPLIAAGGFTGETAAAAIATGQADLVAFGRPFIANPDLVKRLRHGARSLHPTRRRSTRPAPADTWITRSLRSRRGAPPSQPSPQRRRNPGHERACRHRGALAL